LGIVQMLLALAAIVVVSGLVSWPRGHPAGAS
jgi:hypothetical protein